MKKKNGTCSATKDEGGSFTGVTLWTLNGDEVVMDERLLDELEYKWLEESDDFLVLVDGVWYVAQSIDFEFND